MMNTQFLASAASTTDSAVESVSSFWNDEKVQSWLIERPIRIAIILILAIIAHWLLRRVINKVAENSIKSSGLDKQRLRGKFKGRANRAELSQQEEAMRQTRETRRASRIKTLAGVARSAAVIFVWVWAIIAILDELEVNVAPLIASAGVIGVALGFGAQALVKDFLSGIFMLIEDQYGIGDVVDLGNGVFGDVESISLRITTVRDIDGALWYVRNGEILQVANHSDEYSVARIQIPVGLSNDPEVAGEVIEDAVKEAAQDDKVRKLILSTPRVDGMSGFEPDYVSFRVSTKTLPGKQWDVQRFLQSRVLNVMHTKGITTPYPHGIGISDRRKEEEEKMDSVYEAIGGMDTFERLVHDFYSQVKEDDVIGPMYPDNDWEGAEQRLTWFLAQYWGGPQLFSENRGHPRLRMRHAPYPIDITAHDRWLELMGNSLAKIDEETIPPAYREMIWDHMQRVAAMMINKAP